MRVRVTNLVTDYEGNPLQDSGKDVTFRTIFSGALNTYGPDEKPTAEDKAKSFAISVKLFSADDVELTTTEAALIIERVGILYSPIVYGRVETLLNGQVVGEGVDR